ncbi:AVN_HP_G0120020.mRNA.1.CDS.1 [Saccharomyces cerevisiae]|nr:AVN_HP_G0120020.mRNA.1.CDS.1 [Saccharomyces cerevisiae]CAI6997115.1 AVN_HP_G0120020.mRNA.1.CDS.1 [Saccharomyces cerevisiae]
MGGFFSRFSKETQLLLKISNNRTSIDEKINIRNWPEWGDRFNEILDNVKENEADNQELSLALDENVHPWNPGLVRLFNHQHHSNHDVGYQATRPINI